MGMTTTLYYKENGANPIGQLSSMRWWTYYGSQAVYGEPGGQHGQDHQLNATKHSGPSTTGEQVVDKGNGTTFTIFPGDGKTSSDGQKPPQAATSLQPAPPEYHSAFDLGLGQPMICARYPPMDQCYGVFSTYAPQGRIMLPMSLTTDDGPIYVNAKQYHGIMRRRKSRAKAVLQNKLTKKRKPYMHYSRHLHALRRPRGSGGRFLNTKSTSSGKGGDEANKKVDASHLSCGSQSSEVVLSDSGSLNSPKEANGRSSANISISEVTSVFSRSAELDHFTINHLGPPIHSFPGTERGFLMPSKWVAAADSCCNLRA